jgi:hypothetical protein
MLWLVVGYTLSRLSKKLIRVKKKKHFVPKCTTHKYVEKHNTDGIGSSRSFDVPPIANAGPIISHAEYVVPSADPDVTIITPTKPSLQ